MYKLIAAFMTCLCLLCATGCTEEEKAEQKELWLGIPNTTVPHIAILEIDEKDPPEIKSYKEWAMKQEVKAYQKIRGNRQRYLWRERSDYMHMARMERIYNIIDGKTPAYSDTNRDYRTPDQGSITRSYDIDEPGSQLSNNTGTLAGIQAISNRNGPTSIVSDGRGGTTIYGPDGPASYISDGRGGGTLYGPHGTTSVVSDGLGGANIYDPNGASSYVSDGRGGGTFYGPHGTTSIVSDGMGGVTAYGPSGTSSYVSDGMGGGTIY